jgi:DNA-binding MarR family transcriptional regulator
MTTSALYPLIWKIRRVFQQLRTLSDAMLEDLGINASQRAVLESLSDEEQFSVPQIAKQLSVSRQHIQVLVNELLTKELVELADNPSHKRSPLISITSSGMKLFASIVDRERDLLDVLQSSFSNEDLAISLNTLETLEQLLQSKEWEKK